MRSALVLVVLGLSLFGTHAAPAGDGDPPLPALKVELETRRDADFGGTLDAAKKKQQKAVLNCLTLIDAPSTGPLDDLKMFTSVARLLEKAYRADFAYSTAFYSQVEAFSGPILNPLYADSSALAGALGKAAPTSGARKAQKLYLAAIKAINKPNPTGSLSVTGRNSLKGWNLILKGLSLMESAALLPAPTITFMADMGEVALSPVWWTYHSKSRRITLSAETSDPGVGEDHLFHMELQVTPGSTDLGIISMDYSRTTPANGDESFVGMPGTATVTTLDLPGHRFEGTFDIPTDGGFSMTGTFLATWYMDIVND